MNDRFFTVITLVLCTFGLTNPLNADARIELVSQTGTTLSMEFFDTNDIGYTMNFTRPTTQDVWKVTNTALRGIVFGNGNPRYAGAAQRRALGITLLESIRTFSADILTRPFDDLTVYKTYSGWAIGLWQEGSITEIWYVGSMVKNVLARADEEDFDQACEAALADCCAAYLDESAEPPVQIPYGNPDSCVTVMQGCSQAQRDQACDCASTMCQFCQHPPPPPGETDPCSPEQRDMSTGGCNAVIDNDCGLPPSPPEPTLEDVLELLEEILDRIQEIIDDLNNNN